MLAEKMAKKGNTEIYPANSDLFTCVSLPAYTLTR